MAKKTIVFKLENVDENLILPTAIQLGYQPKIEEVTEEDKQVKITREKYNKGDYTLPIGAVIGEEYITGDKKDDDPIVVDYKEEVKTEVDNPVTPEQYFNVVFAEKFIGEIVKPAAVRALTAVQRQEIDKKQEDLKKTEEQVNKALSDSVDVASEIK